jgi:hypothetical protein
MSRRPEGTASARRDRGRGTGVHGDEVPRVLVRPEAYDGPTAQSLVAAMFIDIEERYAGEEEADDRRPSGQ